MNKRIQKFLILVFFFTFVISCSSLRAQNNPPPHDPAYNEAWWSFIPPDNAPKWEVLPQQAGYGEVILSKRTELGLFSNFAPTPFTFKNKTYASLEGFWQATKYPENESDERFKYPGLKWPYTRKQVEEMTGFEAKHAGDIASENMKKMGIDWVTFEGKKMVYKEPGKSPFYYLIVEAMRAKLEQNKNVALLLRQTEGLVLRPDHDTKPLDLLAWQYYQIWMDFRDRK